MNTFQCAAWMAKHTAINALWTAQKFLWITKENVKINVKINVTKITTQFVQRVEKRIQIVVIWIVTPMMFLTMKGSVYKIEKIVFVRLFMILIVALMERLTLMNVKWSAIELMYSIKESVKLIIFVLPELVQPIITQSAVQIILLLPISA